MSPTSAYLFYPLLQVRSFIPLRCFQSQTLATHPSTFIPFLHSCACSKISPALCAYCIGRSLAFLRQQSPLPPSLNSQSARAHKREKDPSKQSTSFFYNYSSRENCFIFLFSLFFPTLAHGCFFLFTEIEFRFLVKFIIELI